MFVAEAFLKVTQPQGAAEKHFSREAGGSFPACGIVTPGGSTAPPMENSRGTGKGVGKKMKTEKNGGCLTGCPQGKPLYCGNIFSGMLHLPAPGKSSPRC